MYREKPIFTEEENAHHNRVSTLMSQCKEVCCFEHEGLLFMFYYVDAVKAFIKNNPTKADFNVWLQRNYQHFKK
jgi:hypothetical protein